MVKVLATSLCPGNSTFAPSGMHGHNIIRLVCMSPPQVLLCNLSHCTVISVTNSPVQNMQALNFMYIS